MVGYLFYLWKLRWPDDSFPGFLGGPSPVRLAAPPEALAEAQGPEAASAQDGCGAGCQSVSMTMIN